jgi:adenylate cyclase
MSTIIDDLAFVGVKKGFWGWLQFSSRAQEYSYESLILFLKFGTIPRRPMGQLFQRTRDAILCSNISRPISIAVINSALKTMHEQEGSVAFVSHPPYISTSFARFSSTNRDPHMKPTFEIPRSLKPYAGVAFGILTIVLTLILFETSFLYNYLGKDVGQTLERKGYDALMGIRGQRPFANDVILVRINEHTVEKLGYPIPRDQMGAAMALLSFYGAKAVALDIFEPPSKDNKDSAESALMAQYLENANNTIQSIGPFIPTTMSVSRSKPGEIDTAAHNAIGRFGIPARKQSTFPRAAYMADYPFTALANVTTAVGHTILIPDSLDGAIRTVPLYIECDGKLYPALGLALALTAMNIQPSQIHFEDNEYGTLIHAGSMTIQTGKLGEVMVNYVGKDNLFERSQPISLYDVLEAGSEKNEKFFARIKNKVCIIGPATRDLGDYYPTPFSESSYGYVVHANLYDTIVTNTFILPAATWIQLLLIILATLTIGFVSYRNPMRIGVLATTLIAVVYLIFIYVAFSQADVWYKIVEPIFAMSVCFATTVSYRAATEGRQRKMVTNMFERYVDSAVVQQLIDNPSMLKLGGTSTEITLLFSDIKGFTTISEKLGPDALVKLLNVYLTEMTNVIMRHQGTVDKFIGDAIMAFWGAPLPDNDAPFNACVSTLEMQDRLQKLQSRLAKYGNIQLRQRVGINTGGCIVGNMGSESKFNYTAMGDPVNIASRLEGVNKQYGTEIMISEMTHSKVAKRIVAREVDKVIVVGKTEPVLIYELMGLADKPMNEATKNFLEVYREGLKSYQARKWEEGIAYMEHAMTFKPQDSVCKLYIERMKLFQINPPDADWNGVFVLHTK